MGFTLLSLKMYEFMTSHPMRRLRSGQAGTDRDNIVSLLDPLLQAFISLYN